MQEQATIYFFQSGETTRYALSVDKTGCSIPIASPRWFLRGELAAEDLPEEFADALEHLVRHGFSVISINDDRPPKGIEIEP